LAQLHEKKGELFVARGIPAAGRLGKALELPDVPLPRLRAVERQADDELRRPGVVGLRLTLRLRRRHRSKLRWRFSGLGGRRLRLGRRRCRLRRRLRLGHRHGRMLVAFPSSL
jgi:hypothetical protein